MAQDTGRPTIGVLGLHVSKETKAILNAADAMGYDTAWLRRENTAVDVQDGTVTLDPDVDVVVNRLLLSSSAHPAEELGLARVFDAVRPTLNPPDAVMTAMHKFATAAALSGAGLPVPDALLALSGDRLNADRDRFGDRAVYKTAIGTHGGGTWQVGPDEPLNPQVGDRQAFLQRLVEHPEGRPRDVRAYVVGGEVLATMNRHAAEGEWRTNVSLGADVSDATDELPEEARDIARSAASVIGLDYAGVDLISDGEEWYVLEANPTAGFRGLFEATGVSPAPYIAKLAVERVGESVDEEHVAELAEVLDDSRPTATPKKARSERVEPTDIGYIEEVVVSGTRGSETVLAKSDTGATRTSIDARLAADVGTGPIKDIVKVRSGSSKRGRSRPVVDIVVGVGGTQHTVAASVEDRGHMQYPLLLGRDILEHYHVDVTRRADRETVDAEE